MKCLVTTCISIINTYFPPCTGLPSHQAAALKLAQWVETTSAALPNRTWPVWVGDFNAKFGYHNDDDGEGWQLTAQNSNAVGPVSPDFENYNGKIVRITAAASPSS